ncbi:MAG TPA: AMP-binding protein [Hypericibacter adhaerens]|jgi:crotonobetaine/carnitine-CoA ligase|uniref:AMP-binding protein n=1 Tax=Hypericibacter adhaerens TaxID=2602016 RepID=UPI002BD26260|nr:AMP-binding protein [Hypericibacter adhaerens]HWA43171.1 AMP-binding protein [Hypericibacter adhaerens]
MGRQSKRLSLAKDYYTVATLLAERAKTSRRRPAIVSDEGSLTYAELEAQSRKLAAGFAARGIGPGTTVLMMLDNHADSILCWLALARLGAVEVPVNTAYLGDVLKHVVRDSLATILILDAAYAERFEDEILDGARLETLILRGSAPGRLPAKLSKLRTIEFASLAGSGPAGGPAIAETSDPRQIMAVMYTSGTTGASKGVRCTFAHALEYSRCVVEVLDLKAGDRYYNMLPLFHIAGQWAAVFACFIAGATVVLKPRFSVSAFWDDIRHHRCNVTLLLGAMANLVHRAPASPADKKHPLDKVLVVPLFPQVKEFARRFGLRVTTNYGSTEVGVPIRAGFRPGKPRLFHLVDARSCGRIVSDRFEVKIVDPNDEEVPPGVAGELVVRPKRPWIVMSGYLNQPEKTMEAWRNLWLHSGDLMMRDKRGNFYFLDRVKDSIRRRGENISSTEVENGILKFPSVLECAVYPVPSPLTEQEVMAAVVAKPGNELDLGALGAFLERTLPKFMVPRFYRLETALPKTPTGKIQKFQLRAQGLDAPHWDREARPANQIKQQRNKPIPGRS